MREAELKSLAQAQQGEKANWEKVAECFQAVLRREIQVNLFILHMITMFLAARELVLGLKITMIKKKKPNSGKNALVSSFFVQ